MKIRVPEYYTEFCCIADKCRDSCCIGWEIDIDDATMAKYKGISGDLGCEIAEKTSHGYFPLCENGRCTFLDGQGLCRIISALGDGYLCDICREHPRYYGVGNGIIEGGLGLGCEEAARMILSLKSQPRLVETEHEVHYSDEDEFADVSECIRERLYPAIFAQEPKMLAKTFVEYARVGDDVAFMASTSEKAVDIPEVECGHVEPDMLCELYESMLSLVSECESLTDEWEGLVARARVYDPTDALARLGDMRGILYYFTHRYVREGVEDMSLGQRVLFALGSAITVATLSDIIAGDDPAILAAVEYSKNIEYSEDNVAYILENTEIL